MGLAVVLIALGVALGMFTTLSWWGGTSVELAMVLFFVSAGCVVGGALQLRPFAAIAWCLAAAVAFLRLTLDTHSALDNGTGEIVLLTTGFALLTLACFAVAVTLSVRLWLRTARDQPRHGQPHEQRTTE